MRLRGRITIRPDVNGHILETTGTFGCKEVNLPWDFTMEQLGNFIIELYEAIDAEAQKSGIKLCDGTSVQLDGGARDEGLPF